MSDFDDDNGDWPPYAEVAARLDSLAHDPGCDTLELSPSLGPSTKPCNCGAYARTLDRLDAEARAVEREAAE